MSPNMLDDDERQLYNAYHTDTVLNAQLADPTSVRLSPAMLDTIERLGLVSSSPVDHDLTAERHLPAVRRRAGS